MQELVIFKGTDQPSEIQFITKETNIPFDLTDNTEIEACFKNEDGTSTIMEKSSGEISIESAIGGSIKIVWTEAKTALLRAGKEMSFFCKLVNASGETRIVPFDNVLTVREAPCG